MSAKSVGAVAGGDIVKKITEYLAPDIAEVDRILRESLDSESKLIREVGQYVCFTSGKKMRPMLALLMTKALAPRRPAPVEVAAALELIHVATLLHDDVIDKAAMRRGRPSVNAQWGDEVAILMADFLFARAFDLALTTLRPEVLRQLCRVTQAMCEGEMFQIELAEKNFSVENYYHVVERKTAALFSACTGLGAFMAGAAEDDIASATSFGYDFGIAFQITDDLLDYVARPEQLGKEIGMDVSAGKQTLPLLLAMARATEQDRDTMADRLGNGKDFDLMLGIIRQNDGLGQAQEEARRFADRAGRALARLQPADPEVFEFLRSLPGYVMDRAF